MSFKDELQHPGHIFSIQYSGDSTQ